jgi:hypothetical protein
MYSSLEYSEFENATNANLRPSLFSVLDVAITNPFLTRLRNGKLINSLVILRCYSNRMVYVASIQQ